MKLKLLAAVLLAGAVIASCSGYPAFASTTPLPWIMKVQPDGALLKAQAALDGVTVPAVQWNLCGFTAEQHFGDGSLKWGRCGTGMVPTYTSYAQILRSVAKGVPQKFGIILYDPEVWKYTPKSEQANPLFYIKLADNLANAKKFKLIVTPYAASPGYVLQAHRTAMQSATLRAITATMIDEEVTAAKHGAYAVDIQSQFANSDPNGVFKLFVTQAMAAISYTNPNTLITVGLSTNNTLPSNLALDYQIAMSLKATGIWLNVPPWYAKQHCLVGPPTQKGCPETGIQFLKLIGVS